MTSTVPGAWGRLKQTKIPACMELTFWESVVGFGAKEKGG